jgi:hypothetical protein
MSFFKLRSSITRILVPTDVHEGVESGPPLEEAPETPELSPQVPADEEPEEMALEEPFRASFHHFIFSKKKASGSFIFYDLQWLFCWESHCAYRFLSFVPLIYQFIDIFALIF